MEIYIKFQKTDRAKPQISFLGFRLCANMPPRAQGFDAARPTAARGRVDFEENFSFAIHSHMSRGCKRKKQTKNIIKFLAVVENETALRFEQEKEGYRANHILLFGLRLSQNT